MKHISLDHPLARGRTADVYKWDDDHVLKLFHHWFPLEDAEYELRIAQAVHASGIKSPVAHELIQVNGRTGLVYDRVNGESMAAMLQHKPWKVFACAKTLAQLHAQMHEVVSDADMPKQHGKLQRKIENAPALPTPLKTALLTVLHSLPESDRVCHGDFHFENVLLTESEPAIIDWMDASCGNPLADVARTSIILLGIVESREMHNPLLKFFLRIFHSTYLREYFRLRPQGWAEYIRWLPIVAGARLSEQIPELEGWLIVKAEEVYQYIGMEQ